MRLPHVGHCPSWAAIDSVASSRDEQYPQLNPYRRPLERMPGNMLFGCGFPNPVRPAPAAAIWSREFKGGGVAGVVGTRKVVEQIGHRTICWACDSSALSGVLQIWQGNTIMSQNDDRVRGSFGKQPKHAPPSPLPRLTRHLHRQPEQINEASRCGHVVSLHAEAGQLRVVQRVGALGPHLHRPSLE